MRCLFLDCPVTVGINYPNLETIDSTLRAVGGNTGNILFRYGIASSVLDELVPCHWAEGQTLAAIDNFDAVVLGAANWLSTYHDNGNERRAQILRALDKPMICIGLGIQSSIRTSKKLEFPQGAMDLLLTLRDLQATVLVRDEFTFDQCIHHGLTKLAVIGCPSSFIDISPSQKETLLAKSKNSVLLERVTLNHGYTRRDICSHDSTLLKSVCETNGQYIVQDNLNGEINAAVKAAHSSLFRHGRSLRIPRVLMSTKSQVKQNLSTAGRNLRVYFDALQWIDSLRSSSVVLGTRIHGCIAALQAGTPSAITTIDSRTDGLAETLGVPRVKISALSPLSRKVRPMDIVQEAGMEFTPYLRRRRELLSTYKQSLKDFGLTLSPRLQDDIECL